MHGSEHWRAIRGGACEGTTWGSHPGGGFFGYTWPSFSEGHDTVVIDQLGKGTAAVTGSGDIFSVCIPRPERSIHAHCFCSPPSSVTFTTMISRIQAITHGLVIVNPVTVNLMALLEGPYSSGVMSTALRLFSVPPRPSLRGVTLEPCGNRGATHSGECGRLGVYRAAIRDHLLNFSRLTRRVPIGCRNDDLDGTSPVAVPGITARLLYCPPSPHASRGHECKRSTSHQWERIIRFHGSRQPVLWR